MNRRSWLKGVAFVALAPVLVAAAFFTYLYLTQESAVFQGTSLPPDFQFSFEVPFEEITLTVDDAEISALHFRQPNPRGLIFFLHGNAGNLQSWTSDVEYYQRVNYDMFMLDYRGFGKSTGHIESEEQLHNDVRLAWNSIEEFYADKPIVIYGRSLGTAMATKLAVDVNPDLLILVSPFSSVVAMARQQYPYLPERLVRYPMRTDKRIAAVKSPTILVHGTEDRLIPVEHSLTLKELVIAPSKLLLIEGAGHGDIHLFKDYLEGLTNELPN